MADFDPQNPADESNGTATSSPGSCCGGAPGGSACGDEAFVADWSHAEGALSAQADAFEARRAAGEAFTPDDAFWADLVRSQRDASKPGEAFWADLVRSQRDTSRPGEAFWAELVRSQGVTPSGGESTRLARRFEPRVGVQSEAFWAELVRSQQPASTTADSDYRRVPSPHAYTLTSPPTGMGWADDEASEWAPPESGREPAEDEAVQPAGEPVEAEVAGSAPRDDVEWGVPVSAEEDWALARSEGMAFEPASDEVPSLMSAAVEAAQRQAKGGASTQARRDAQPKATKTRAAKPAVAKKPAAKKAPARAKQPAAKAQPKPKKLLVKKAKKPAAKKPVKKAAPAGKITKAPTRRAA